MKMKKDFNFPVRENGAGSIQFFPKKNTINHYHIFCLFFVCHIIIVIILTTPTG